MAATNFNHCLTGSFLQLRAAFLWVHCSENFISILHQYPWHTSLYLTQKKKKKCFLIWLIGFICLPGYDFRFCCLEVMSPKVGMISAGGMTNDLIELEFLLPPGLFEHLFLLDPQAKTGVTVLAGLLILPTKWVTTAKGKQAGACLEHDNWGRLSNFTYVINVNGKL